MRKKWISIICTVVLLFSTLTIGSVGFTATKTVAPAKFVVKQTNYKNASGVGIFYPKSGATLSGIAKIYGLAYIGEGWKETKVGIGKVTVKLGDKKVMTARTYVKNRYWIRTFDTKTFKDGPINVVITAYDMKNKLVGTATEKIIIDNKNTKTQKRYYAAPNGKYMGTGTKDLPWDVETGIQNLKPGDILFLRGGIYRKNIEVNKNGTAGKPITIMAYPGEKVQLKSAGIDVAYGTENVNIMGIDQSGLTYNDSGLELGLAAKYIQVWDCSFNYNTHPYEKIPISNDLDYGTGFIADSNNSADIPNREYITVSHCEAKYNDVDGFQFSNINHGRYQYLESAWNPNHKTSDVFQYHHANGFAMDNYGAMAGSTDNAFLYCYSHHNGQDGWDLRPANVAIISCVTHDESQAGHNFGGVGFKFWEENGIIINGVNFDNNLIDGSGCGTTLPYNSAAVDANGVYTKNVKIYNTLFYNTYFCAVDVQGGVEGVVAKNNIFYDYTSDFRGEGVKSNNSIYYGIGSITLPGDNIVKSNPKLINPKMGNFFLNSGSPALTAGDPTGVSCIVDGIDYAKYDGLGRLRVGKNEVGPYTRFKN